MPIFPCFSKYARTINGKKHHRFDEAGVCMLCYKSKSELERKGNIKDKSGKGAYCPGSFNGRHVFNGKECLYCGTEEE